MVVYCWVSRNANEELKDGTSTDDEAEKLANTPPEIKRELEKVEAIKKEGQSAETTPT